MAPPYEEFETLGVKHKKYNELVQNAIANKTQVNKDFSIEKNDLDTLKNIDIASHNKDINYILSVLKCADMLYVSRALQQSPWLVNDEYAHIINPPNLTNHLFPEMTTKASIKLLKHIRRHLKNETRVEEFYKNEANIKEATKWLSRCSIPFIEEHIRKHVHYLELFELKILCEKSITIFERAFKDLHTYNYRYANLVSRLQVTSFVLNTYPDKYLNAVERVPMYHNLKFNKKTTNLIMKQARERVMQEIERYLRILDIPTFAKCLQPDEIKDFLYKLANSDTFFCHFQALLFRYDILKHFINTLPKEEQFEFVKTVFFDKKLLTMDEQSLGVGTELYAKKRIYTAVCIDTPAYYLYKFATFDVAFTEIKKLIHNEESFYEKYRMLKVLIEIADDNMKHLQSLLVYYNNQHVKDNVEYKSDFINNLLSITKIHKYSDHIWQELNKCLTNMGAYEKEFDNQNCIEAILLYNLINNKPIPDIIKSKFVFNTLLDYKNKLDNEEREKIFIFLYNYIRNKIDKHYIKDENSFEEATILLEKLFDLLLDWDKSLPNYTYAREKMRFLLQLKYKNSWKGDLKCLYNKNKSWRKHMFEESIYLYPTEDVCLNALKHDPDLLQRQKKAVQLLRCDDKVSLVKVNKKLRIYFPQSLAPDWTEIYMKRLKHLGGHKAVIRGICTLLTPKPLSDVIQKYAPEEPKIDWSKTNELELSLQRTIAKNMHIARPQPSPDAILLYAKGDYLQYALPSLHAIFYNLSRFSSREHVPKMLDAPVSLRKHGLRFAFSKLDQKDLKRHLENIWNTSKNFSIRAVIFELTFNLMCKEKDEAKVESIWELLELFMDNLTFKDDKKIYETLNEIEKVPLKVQAPFLKKGYKLLKDLYAHDKNEDLIYKLDRLANYTRMIMKFMCPEFMEELIKEFIDEKFYKYEGRQLGCVSQHCGLVLIITAYILSGQDEQTQLDRYNKVIAPLMTSCFNKWNETNEGDYFIRRHLQQVLIRLCKDLQYALEHKLTIPTKVYQKVSMDLQGLPMSENYVLLRLYKLTIKLAELVQKNNNQDKDAMLAEVVPQFAKVCVDYLKEDVKLYFPSIYQLFLRALDMATSDIINGRVKLILCEHLLDEEFHQSYLTALRMFPPYVDPDHKHELIRVRKIIKKHPSVEVKMHFYNYFKNALTDDESSI